MCCQCRPNLAEYFAHYTIHHNSLHVFNSVLNSDFLRHFPLFLLTVRTLHHSFELLQKFHHSHEVLHWVQLF